MSERQTAKRTNMSRRHFLRSLGSGAAVICTGNLTGVPSLYGAQAPDVTRPGNFGRMFRLPPFAPPTNAVREALLDIGKAGGIMDAQDDLAAGAVALITDAGLNVVNQNSSSHSAGVTFFGQFLDHDMTFDPRSRLGFPTPPINSSNTRTPFFDLDSVYGGGPTGTPELFESADPIKFRVESGGQCEDLPRDPANNAALIGDPRNDENLIIAGMHAAFLRFHNNAVNYLRQDNPGIANAAAFSQARRLTTWHYQWIILHEFLPLISGQAAVNKVMANGRRYFHPLRDQEFIPVEFQIIYRFGHSMVRPSYRANLNGDNGLPFFAMIFDPQGQGMTDPVDLRGGARASRRFIDWQTFFDFGGAFTTDMRPNKKIDTKISTPLFHLPLGTIAGGTGPISLMQRNLLRHLTWQLPSGQSIAREMAVPVLESTDLAELGSIRPSFVESTPLLYYILKEAQVREGGLRLGPVGAGVVAEVFIGLLQLDPNSYLRVQPDWTPTLPAQGATQQSFRMIDFLTFAGVDPTSRGY